jgi:hypothetical protein
MVYLLKWKATKCCQTTIKFGADLMIMEYVWENVITNIILKKMRKLL